MRVDQVAAIVTALKVEAEKLTVLPLEASGKAAVSEIQRLVEQLAKQMAIVDVPRFDKAALTQLTDGQPGMITDLVQFFCDKVPGQIAELSAAIQAKNYETIRHLAHKIKGSAASYGAKKLQQIMFILEQAAANQQMDSVTAQFSVASEEFQFFCAELKNWMASQ